jgi:hypothetical protein
MPPSELKGVVRERKGMSATVPRLTAVGLSDRQLDVRWLELLPEIIVDVRLISVHAEQSEGLERHIAQPVVFLEITVVVAPRYFLSWSDR